MIIDIIIVWTSLTFFERLFMFPTPPPPPSFQLLLTACTGCTGLLVAVAAKNLNAVMILLEHGSCPNTSTNEGWSPLHQACWNIGRCTTEGEVRRAESIVLALLDCGADPSSVCQLEGDFWEYSPLHFCALARHSGICSETIWLAICRFCHPQTFQVPAGDSGVTPYHLLQYGRPPRNDKDGESNGDIFMEMSDARGMLAGVQQMHLTHSQAEHQTCYVGLRR